MRSETLLRIFLFAVGILALAAPTAGQTNDPRMEVGNPFAISTGSTIDDVEMPSGALRLRIPPLHLKGRGLDLDVVFSYNSRLWQTQQFSDPSTGNITYITDQAGGGWSYGVPGMGHFSDGVITCKLSNADGVCMKFVLYINWWDSDGTKHVFGNDNGEISGGSPATYWTFDGSYMRIPQQLSWNTNPPVISKVMFKNGKSLNYFFSSQNIVDHMSMEDTNGNSITCWSNEPCVDTLGRTLRFNYANAGTPSAYLQSITYLDSSGATQTITFSYQTLTLAYPLTWANQAYCYGGRSPCALVRSHTVPTLTAITLPDGRSYSFEYFMYDTNSSTGEITKVTLPTGGYIRYTYGWNPCPNAFGPCDIWDGESRQVIARTVSSDGTAGSEQTWSYAYNLATGTPGMTNVVTDPLGNTETSTWVINAYPYFCTSLPTQIDYRDSQGHLLRQVVQTLANDNGSYNDPYPSSACSNPRITGRTTRLGDTGQASAEIMTYGSRGNLAEKDVYDWDGTLLGKTTFTYLHDANATYGAVGVHILDRITSHTALNGSGAQVARTLFEYDNYSRPNQQMQPSAAIQHDATYNTSFTVRGNVTAVQRWRNTDGALLSTTNQFDDAGNVLMTIDPGGHPTTFSYQDSWANNSCAPSGGKAAAYVTSITNALGQIISNTYNSCTGTLASTTDANNQTTVNSYDPIGRTTQVAFPDGGQIANCYSDTQGASCYSPSATISITTTTKISSILNMVTMASLDGLGRLHKTALTSDSDGTTYTRIDYDALGRKAKVWNPTRCDPDLNPTSCTGESTFGTTQYQYDGLGRVTQLTSQDGGAVTSTYAGNCATVADQAGKRRKSCRDVMGRVTQVFEPDANNNLVNETDYQYDMLNNLTCAEQHGNVTGTGCSSPPSNDATSPWRVRRFTYNSLSQLTSAANPEISSSQSPPQICAITYSYDNDGNVLTKVTPTPNQPNCTPTLTTTYSYDQLHRVTQKSYSDGTTPTVKYGYDAINPSGCTPPALTISNGIGRRTSMCDGSGAAAWSVDLTVGQGWKATEARTLNGVTKTIIYQKNFAGMLAQLTYPSGRTITYGAAGAGRALSAKDTTSNTNYVIGTCGPTSDGACYTPHGALASLTNGGSIVSTFYYNNRLQPCRISVKSGGTAPTQCSDTTNIGNVLDFSYNFNLGTADNGNVVSITNNRDANRMQNFTYDSMNRIATAYTSGNLWGETFQIDQWGNLNKILPYSGKPQPENLNQMAGNNNRFVGMSYDAAGNLLNDGASAYFYDAENRIQTGAGVTYTYDGDGKQVQKSTGKLYWYGMSSDPLDETDLAGNTSNAAFNEYIFFGGKRIARRDSSANIYYYFADHLGSSRIITSAAGVVCYDADFYPFGGERLATNTCPQNYKFTGKERDSESGLDNFGARYDSSSMGRFMSPDPLGGRMIDPQTLNKYSYVRNNPINLTDPTGMYECKDDNNQCKTKQDIAFEKARQQDLKSKDKDVVRGAKAYGDPTKDNGVTVQFGDPGAGRDANTTHDLRVDPNDSTKFQAVETVTVKSGLSGSGLDAAVGHEGSHVADAQDFAATINMQGGFDASKNLSTYQTEFRAYMVTQSILSSENAKFGYGDCGVSGLCILGTGIMPAQAQQTINQLLANPANRYGTAPNYGVTPGSPGPVLYPLLTTPK